jgi:hypothetical protein
MKQLACAAAAIAIAAGAHAQSRPRPDDPAAAAPPPAHASAFADYRPMRDEPLSSWREVNDEAGRVGGHTGVVRAEQTAERPTPPPAPSAPTDAKRAK